MPIVGTAGHVDHGKSTLVQALTGRDPDRWDEEKRRGLTIDLGFASATIDGIEFGFVDVPGHERFIKNMLAGVVGVDCALLVVAADSGWMPQTEEHVRVLDLIGADRGIIVLTRIDLVDQDTIELAELEIAEEVAGTSLSDWPVVPASAVTGQGLDDVRSVLAEVGRSTHADATLPFRLWVDRAFAIHGSGTVVTGTVQRGSLAVDDTVEIQPSGITARIRGLHRHDQPVEAVSAGQRAAINLSGVELDSVERGALLATPGTSMATQRLLVDARPTRGFTKIPSRGAFHVHSGTADRPARIRRIDGSTFTVTMDEALPAICGDRIVIRESGRQAVVGGGPILDPSPLTTRAIPEPDASAHESPADRILRSRDIDTIERIRRATGGLLPDSGYSVGAWYISEAFVSRVQGDASRFVEAYHADHPRRPGLPVAELSATLGVEHDIVVWVVERAEGLRLVEGFVATTSFSDELDAGDRAAVDAAIAQLNTSFDVPRSSQLGLDEDLMRGAIRRAEIVQIEPDLVFTVRQIDEIKSRLSELPDGFTVSEFKDHFGMARRQSVPLLEWLDKTGVTRRSGDGRTVR